jgi:hypothetical protein
MPPAIANEPLSKVTVNLRQLYVLQRIADPPGDRKL